MNKTRTLTVLFLTIFILGGCSNSNSIDISTSDAEGSASTWKRDGIYFNYPNELVASYGETGNIQVFKAITFSEYANKCASDMSEDYEIWQRQDGVVKRILEGLKELKNNGAIDSNKDTILAVDNDGCGWTAGNIKAKPITISGLNGVIFERCECQDIGWLNSLYTTLIFVNKYDEVYEIRFRYNFGDFSDGLPENPVSDDEWKSVYNFFLEGTPIKPKLLQGFMDNREEINKIISSVIISE